MKDISLSMLVAVFLTSCSSSNSPYNNELPTTAENTTALTENQQLQIPNTQNQGDPIELQARRNSVLDRQWILAAVVDSTGQRHPVFQESNFQFTLFLSTDTIQIPHLNNTIHTQVFGYNICNGQSYGGAYQLDDNQLTLFSINMDAGGCDRSLEVQPNVWDNVLFRDAPVMWSLTNDLLLLQASSIGSLEFGLQSSFASDGTEISTFFNRRLLDTNWYIDRYTDSSGVINQIPREAEWLLSFQLDTIERIPLMTLSFGPCFVAHKAYYTHDVDIRTQGETFGPDNSCTAQAQLVLPTLERQLLNLYNESNSFFAVTQDNMNLTLQVSSGATISLSLR